VRDAEKRKELPEDERKSWQALWDDVHEALDKLKTPKE
jgi:hypothetical protein